MRPVDHCVLPTGDLTVARKRLTALGFTVAPDARHPFGTGNCCVYFADGTYLEPLAVEASAKVEASVKRGNVFTARDRSFRYRIGDEGFSGLVFGTEDARRDHREFTRAGVSAGRMLNFSRPFVDVSGNTGTASFKLAFAADPRAPDAFFFTCQRVNTPAVDRAALQAHANGVQRIKGIVLETPDPSRFVDFLALVTGAAPVERAGEVAFAAANAEILLRKVADTVRPRPGLSLSEIVLGCLSLSRAEAVLNAGGVGYSRGDGRLTVPATTGQGAALVLEEISSH